jgi:hypothetical protein
MAMRSLTVLMLIFAAASLAAVEKAVFWMPYAADIATVALYHLDAAAAEGELEAAEEGEAANAVPTGRPAVLEGGAACVAEGRFGGGARLAGGRLVVPNMPNDGWTFECWLKPDKPAGTLLQVGAVRVDALADGHLRVTGLTEQPVSTAHTIATGRWLHLALACLPAWGNPAEGRCMLYLDGAPALRSDAASLARVLAALKAKTIAISGGWVDEIRLSTTAREFYRPELDWVDTDGKRPAPTGPAYFRAAGDLRLWLTFDGTLVPAVAPPTVKVPPIPPDELAVATGKYALVFAGGVGRQGLLLTGKGDGLAYTGTDMLHPARGAIAFWSRPLDWDNSRQWNQFANFHQEFAPVFTLTQGKQTAAAFAWVKTPDHDTTLQAVPFHPGRWTHVVLAWEGDQRIVYVDGAPWPHAGSIRWQVGAWDADQPLTLTFAQAKWPLLIDDVRCYGRMPAPAEIANLVALYDRRATLKPLPPLDCVVESNGVIGTVEATIYPLLAQPVAAVSVTLRAADGTALMAATGKVQPDAPLRLRLRGAPFDFGAYTLTLTALDAKQAKLATVDRPIIRVKPAWWGSTAGQSDRVMPDWTPVRVDGDAVQVSGRMLRFAGSGLPAGITSASGEVLAAPVMLRATRKGAPLALAPDATSTLRLRDETRAEIAGRLRGDGFSVQTSAYTEFDGMTWFTLTLTPDAGKTPTLDTLSLEIPYTPDSAALLHWWSGSRNFRDPKIVWIGETPAAMGAVFRSNDAAAVSLPPELRGSFIPYVMLTGDRRGMAWFAENDHGWTQTAAPAVTITRSPNAVTLALHLITAPMTLTGPRVISFGLHPIPVKPLDPAWRGYQSWTVIPDGFAVTHLRSDTGGLAASLQRHPDNLDWERARWRFEGSHGYQGYGKWPPGNQPHPVMVPGLYLNLRGLTAVPADTREWRADWTGVGWGQADTLRYTPAFQDFGAWWFNEWVRRGLCYGIYLDDTWNAPQRVAPGPCAYLLPDGHVQPGYQWLGHREHIRRLRQVFYDHTLTPHMCTHMTHTNFIPYQSFFDVALDGEDHYNNDPNTTWDLMDRWTPARLRFNNPEKWGIASEWLGWHAGGFQSAKFALWAYRRNRAYAGALLVHDLVWLNEEMWPKVLDRAWVQASGLRSDPAVTFLPYWSSASPATHAHPGLYVSVWRREGRCVVALANWGRARIEATVRLDAKRMGFGVLPSDNLTVTDPDHAHVSKIIREAAATDPDAAPTLDDDLDAQAQADAAFTWDGGILTCPVRGHDFRVFEFVVK